MDKGTGRVPDLDGLHDPIQRIQIITSTPRRSSEPLSSIGSSSTRVQISERPEAGPSPFGRRWPEGPDEGQDSRIPNPHPALPPTLSRRERDTPCSRFSAN